MQFQVLLLLALAIGVCGHTKWHQLDNYSFEDYVLEFEKHYDSKEEYTTRRAIFQHKLDTIRAHNRDPSKTWKMGVNHLSDRTEEEFKWMLGATGVSPFKRNAELDVSIDLSALPDHVDYREKHVITAVKDQGHCGSCWAFGTTETVESHYALATGQLTVLSEQQILDCTPNPDHCGGTGGCQGGTPELAYKQIMKMHGLSTEWTYPYISYIGNDFHCESGTQKFHPVAKLKDYVVLPSNKYEPVMEALANVGPLAVNVDASLWSSYESGVFDGCNQTHPDIDHVVQLVGYGTDSEGGPYWLVRNSWSPNWGEAGYIRLKRDSNVRCGVDLKPQDGTGCDGGPSKVTVCGTCAILYDVSYPIIEQ